MGRKPISRWPRIILSMTHSNKHAASKKAHGENITPYHDNHHDDPTKPVLPAVTTLDSPTVALHEQEQIAEITSCKVRSVQFGNVSIRTYPQILGDHPSCTCPLMLAWKHEREHTVTVDEHASTRIKKQPATRLVYEERYAIATANGALSTQEVRKVCRRQSRQQAWNLKGRNRQQQKLSKTFFFCDDEEDATVDDDTESPAEASPEEQ